MKEINFEKDMKIDPDQLDVEWLGQADLARLYAKNAATLRKRANQLEEQIKITRAELTRKVNKDPEKHTGKEKPTGSDIEAFYRTRTEFKSLKQQWIDAIYEAEYAEMAYKEISFARKTSLENLVRLHEMMYFAGPLAPRNLSKEWKAKKEQSTKEFMDKVSKRKESK